MLGIAQLSSVPALSALPLSSQGSWREREVEGVRSGYGGWRGAPEELGWGKVQTKTR